MRDVHAELNRKIDRRSALRWFGVGLLAVPAVKLLACDTAEPSIASDTDADEIDDGETFVEATPEATTEASETPQEVVVEGWATGGTAAMVATASYPDPFAGGGTSCELLCAATIGPCHTTSPERQDVSDGLDGLPVRLSLRLVDVDCQPIANAIVEIWHTNYKGGYSGQIVAMCNLEAADLTQQFMRGYQRTDEDGRVDFDTCFPGWYRGRVVHIHFRVLTGDYVAADNAAATVVSQLFFDHALTTEIFDEAPLYADFGQPDTTLTTDNVVGSTSDKTPYILDHQRMSDGVMLASKTLVVRTDDSANCTMGR